MAKKSKAQIARERVKRANEAAKRTEVAKHAEAAGKPAQNYAFVKREMEKLSGLLKKVEITLPKAPLVSEAPIFQPQAAVFLPAFSETEVEDVPPMPLSAKAQFHRSWGGPLTAKDIPSVYEQIKTPAPSQEAPVTAQPGILVCLACASPFSVATPTPGWVLDRDHMALLVSVVGRIFCDRCAILLFNMRKSVEALLAVFDLYGFEVARACSYTFSQDLRPNLRNYTFCRRCLHKWQSYNEACQHCSGSTRDVGSRQTPSESGFLAVSFPDWFFEKDMDKPVIRVWLRLSLAFAQFVFDPCFHGAPPDCAGGAGMNCLGIVQSKGSIFRYALGRNDFLSWVQTSVSQAVSAAAGRKLVRCLGDGEPHSRFVGKGCSCGTFDGNDFAAASAEESEEEESEEEGQHDDCDCPSCSFEEEHENG